MNDRPFWPGTNVLPGAPQPSPSARLGKTGPDRNTAKTIQLLTAALGIARAGVARAEQQYCVAFRSHSPGVTAAALERANTACAHVERLARQLSDLGGETQPVPARPSANDPPSQGAHGRSFADTLAADLLAQRASIKTYRKIAHYCQTIDPTSQKLVKDIISAEEQSAADLTQLTRQSPTATG